MSTEDSTFSSFKSSLLIPSLEDLSLLAAVKASIQHDDVKRVFYQQLTSQFSFSRELVYYRAAKVNDICMAQIQVPEIFKRKLLCAIKWIRDEYFKWIKHVVDSSFIKGKFSNTKHLINHAMNSAIWDLKGSINYELSDFQLAVQLENPTNDEDIFFLFEKASKCCLEENVKFFWGKLSYGTKSEILSEGKYYYLSTVYWAYVMSNKKHIFPRFVWDYLNKTGDFHGCCRKMLELFDVSDVNNMIFLISVLKGTLMSVKYFFGKVSCIDLEHVIDSYLIYAQRKYGCGWRDNVEDLEVLFFLLTQINDDIAMKILSKHAAVVIKLCIKHWPFQKFIVMLVKLFPSCMDQALMLDLISKLIYDVYRDKSDIFLLKSLWRVIPSELKKSFCSFISQTQKNYSVSDVWRYATFETMNLFLREDECRKILTPYGNYGITLLIQEKQFNLINHWLKKRLVSKKAIISFMEHFIVKKLVKLMKYYSLSTMIKILNWCCNYEGDMDKEKILKVKGLAIEAIGVKGILNGIKLNKWEDLKKFTDWIMKDRDDYEEKLLSLKVQALMMLFEQKGGNCWKYKNFTENFIEFLNYKITNMDKLSVFICKMDFHESENCEIWLKKNLPRSFDSFLEFISEYGRDVLSVKRNIFKHIFSKDEGIEKFNDMAYSENIKKLIDWNCENDSLASMNKNILEIRMEIYENYAVKIIVKSVLDESSDAVNNFMNCLFKDGSFGKFAFDLKKRVIDELLKEDLFWGNINHFTTLAMLINYGKDNKYIKKEIWATKKYFIEKFKENTKGGIIPELILGEEDNFVFSFFGNEVDEKDFEKTLWDFKEFLLKTLANVEDYLLLAKLFERFEELNEFLNWNNVSKVGMKDLKKLILNGNGAGCCLKWILENDFSLVEDFLKWCVFEESNMEAKLLKLKNDVLKSFLCKFPENWIENNFQSLDNFLVLYDKKKDLKKDCIEKYGVKGCAKMLAKGYVKSVENFMNWAYEGKLKSIHDFKRNLLKEILQCECIDYWKKNCYLSVDYLDFFFSSSDDEDDENKYDFHIALDKFLYEYHSPDNSIIANMKFDLIEIHFHEIFKKLLAERKFDHLKNIVSWTFDEKIKSSEEIFPRLSKFKKEIFDKFGKEYCVIMLENINWESAAKFCEVCSPPKKEVKIKDFKILLWDFKKDCIRQVLRNYIIRDIHFGLQWKHLWMEMNRFLTWRHATAKMKDEIFQFKNIMRKEYGISIIKKIFEVSSNKDYIDEPKYFLRWLFGVKNSNSEMVLNEDKLFDFKKEVLENLLYLEFDSVLKADGFYKALEKVLLFNTTNVVPINNLKKSVINVQGVQLCIDLICKDNVQSLQKFLQWVVSVFDGDIIDFKKAAVIRLAENLTLAYNWESLKSFLDYGFDLNNEQDSVKYMDLKNYVSETCSVDICYNYILKNQWDDVSIFLEWSLEPIGNQKLIKFKTCLIEKHGPDYCNARISDSDWEKLEKFLIWSFESHSQDNELEEIITNLKIKTLQKDISYKDRLDIVLRYLEWGFKSKARLNKFKKNILGKTHPLNYFVTLRKYKSQKTFQVWFSNKK